MRVFAVRGCLEGALLKRAVLWWEIEFGYRSFVVENPYGVMEDFAVYLGHDFLDIFGMG